MSKQTKITLGLIAFAGTFYLGFAFGAGFMKRPISRAFMRDVKVPTQRVLDDIADTAKNKNWDGVEKKIIALRDGLDDAYIDRPLDEQKIMNIGKETGTDNKGSLPVGRP